VAQVGSELKLLATQEAARASWETHGLIITVRDLLAEAPALANALAAEHVEIATDDPQALFAQIRHAGSVFWAATRRKPWAIMSPAPTMCCPPGGAPVSPRASRCWIS
jgi:histidinol dehydrogenase